MNKKVAFILFVLFSSVTLFSSGLGITFNTNYNIGNSEFFTLTERLYVTNGFNYLESKNNKLGMGFNFGFEIPVASRFSVIPSFTVNFGYQQYEFTKQESAGDSDMKDNYSFFIFSGELKVNYDVIVLRNGWRVTLLLGFDYNNFKADNETGLPDVNFWGAQGGIGVKFFQLEHFGFQSFVIYRYPFNEKNFEYLTIQAGLIYKF